MLTTEQILAAQKSQFDSLMGLSFKGFDTVEKILELNLQTAKTLLGEAQESAKAALAAKDMQALFALQGSLMQPSAEKATAYGRRLYDITSAATADVSKVAEASAADAKKKMLALVDSAVKTAPAGSENAVSMVKAAVTAANDAFESAQKAAKQAAGVAEANFATFTAQALKSVPATGKAKRAA